MPRKRSRGVWTVRRGDDDHGNVTVDGSGSGPHAKVNQLPIRQREYHAATQAATHAKRASRVSFDLGSDTMEHSLDVEIPLKSADQASAVYNALRPDPELKPNEISKSLELHGKNVRVSFEAVSERSLRVGVNSFMDNLSEALECLSAFYPEYYENGSA